MSVQMPYDSTEKEVSRRSRSWLWVPLLYFFRGMVLASLLSVTLVMLKRMGMSNALATASTAWLALPWVLRLLLRRVTAVGGTPWHWVVAMQAVFALAMLGVALTEKPHSGGMVVWIFLAIGALSGGIHDVVASDLSAVWVSGSRQKEDLASIGRRQVVALLFFLLALLVGLGLVLVMAGDMEVLSRSMDESWSTTFKALALFLIALACFVALALPRHVAISHIPSPSLANSRTPTFGWFWGGVLLVLFTLHQWMLWRGTLLFLVDPGSIGGLSLGPQEVGFAQGTVSVLAMMMGCVLGWKALSKWGMTRCLLPMAAAATLPDVMLLDLAFRMPTDLLAISTCLSIEAFGCGFAMIGLILYIRCNAYGKGNSSHADICLAWVMLSAMIGGWCTGLFQDYFGYRRFFMIVSALAIMAFVAATVSYLISKNDKDTHCGPVF